VLFVSHQLEMVARLCRKAVWLEHGTLKDTGAPEEVIHRYFDWTMQLASNSSLANRRRKIGQNMIRVRDVWIETGQSPRTDKVEAGQQMTIVVDYEPANPDYVAKFIIGRIGIHDSMDRLVCRLSNEFTGEDLDGNGRGLLRCTIPRLPLRDGTYYLNVELRERGILQEKVFNTAYFEVLPTSFFKILDPREGMVLVPHSWHAQQPAVVT
jgi:hypothetical protein